MWYTKQWQHLAYNIIRSISENHSNKCIARVDFCHTSTYSKAKVTQTTNKSVYNDI